MADFCKEYIEKYDNDGMKPDFSIEEEFDKLNTDHYTTIICEGYGFIGIANQNDECKLIYRNENAMSGIDLVDYDNLDKHYLLTIR